MRAHHSTNTLSLAVLLFAFLTNAGLASEGQAGVVDMLDANAFGCIDGVDVRADANIVGDGGVGYDEELVCTLKVVYSERRLLQYRVPESSRRYLHTLKASSSDFGSAKSPRRT